MQDFLNTWYPLLLGITTTIVGGVTTWYFGVRQKNIALRQAEMELEAKRIELDAERKRLDTQHKQSEHSLEADSHTSIDMLITLLEDVRKKLILEIAKGVKNAKLLSEREKLLNDLKMHCPDCYNTFVDKYGIRYGLDDIQKHDSDE